jgi:hypothetical protein
MIQKDRIHPIPAALTERHGLGECLIAWRLAGASLIRMRSQVQVLAGPPPNPAGQSVAAIEQAAPSALLVHIWSTS